jgi:excisionase family DNA binding protein
MTHRHRRIHTNSPIQPDTERKPAMSLPISPTWGQPAPEWLSLQQAAAMYGVSVDTLRRRIASGKLRASRFGVRLIRVRVEDLDRLFRPIPMGDDLTQRRARARNQRSW